MRSLLTPPSYRLQKAGELMVVEEVEVELWLRTELEVEEEREEELVPTVEELLL